VVEKWEPEPFFNHGSIFQKSSYCLLDPSFTQLITEKSINVNYSIFLVTKEGFSIVA